MSPFIMQNGIGASTDILIDSDDDIYNAIVDNITQAKAYCDNGIQLTDKNLEETLQLKEAEVRRLKEQLDEKAKTFHELNGHLERIKLQHLHNKHQVSCNHQITADVFKDIKIFKSKVDQEIRQRFASYGLEIEFQCHESRTIVKIQKGGKWFELGLNDQLNLELLDMNPRHNRFDEIKLLFDSTRNVCGLFSIYNWNESK